MFFVFYKLTLHKGYMYEEKGFWTYAGHAEICQTYT